LNGSDAVPQIGELGQYDSTLDIDAYDADEKEQKKPPTTRAHHNICCKERILFIKR